jgi:hypothetical protein
MVVKYFRGAECDTDHCLVVAEVNIYYMEVRTNCILQSINMYEMATFLAGDGGGRNRMWRSDCIIDQLNNAVSSLKTL